LAVDQRDTRGRQLFRHDDLIAWLADVPNSREKYLAVFNARDASDSPSGTPIPVRLSDLGFNAPVSIRDLWTHTDLGSVSDEFAPAIPAHGAGLYRISAE
jgi:alpha-galactosidase